MQIKSNRIITCLLFLFLNIGITNLCQAYEFEFIDYIKSKFSATDKTKLPKVNKGISDKNKYQLLKLNNGLTVLLISDPSADKSAISMNVGVGSSKNPSNYLGAAHLLEHMLFLGTKNYPNPDSYNAFIAKGNGYRNAYTSAFDTNYFLSINSSFFQEALARFSDFFINPKLDPKYIEKEKHAVNSEYKKNLQNDNFIIYENFLATANPNNPENRFFCGNLETLDNKDGKLYGVLTDFFTKYYVADNMTLAIYSPEKISVLKYWVKKYFSAIASGDKAETTKELYVNAAQQGVMVNIETIKKENNLVLEFYFPFDKKQQNSSVFSYINSFLVDNFFKPLKDQGLILGGDLDVSKIKNNHITCTVYTDLTNKGVDAIEQITADFFDVINYIKNTEYKDYIVKQEQLIAKQQFNYSEAKRNISSVISASTNMKYYPLENVLDIHYKLDDLNKPLLDDTLKNFTWKNLRIFVTGNNLAVDTKLPYYNTSYKKTAISKKLIARIEKPKSHDFFKPPVKNNFITDDLSIKSTRKFKWARLIEDERGIRSWYMTDHTSNVPKGSIHLLLSNTKPLLSAKNVALNMLYSRVVNSSIEEAQALAESAGIYNTVSATPHGLKLTFEGFQDKQPKLLKQYVQHIKNPSIKKNKFDAAKEDIIDILKNNKFEQPYIISNYWLKSIVNPNFFLDEELITAIKDLQIQDLRQFINSYCDKIHLDVLVYGNYTKKDAKYITKEIKNSFLNDHNKTDSVVFTRRSLDGNFVFSKKVENNNSCCSNYYRITGDFIQSSAMAMLTKNLLKENFFSKLRTEAQLGYIIYATWTSIARQAWVGFVVQSDVANPLYISGKIKEFIKKQKDYLEKLSDKEFNSYKRSIVKSIREEKQTANLIWEEIINYDGDIKTTHHITKKIKKLSKEDIIKLVESLSTDLDSLSVQLWGTNDIQQKSEADNKQKACNDLNCFNHLSLIRYK